MSELDVEELVSALTGDEDGRRLLALEALQECDRRGPMDSALLTALLAGLGHQRKVIRRVTAEVLALWERVTPEIRASLLRLLAAPDFHSRWGAAFALAKIGPEAAALPALIEALGQADGDMRWAAEAILVDFARRNREARKLLVDLVRTGTPPQRKMTIYCLRDLGEPIAELRDLLVDQLKALDFEVRLAAVSALARLYASSAEIVPAMIAVARADPELGVRRAAVSALGKLCRPGGEANRAADAEIDRVLDEAAGSADESLRKAALTARRREGGPTTDPEDRRR